MTITTKIRFVYGIILLFNLWLIGEYNIKGLMTGFLTFGFVFIVEIFIINNLPLDKLSVQELRTKLKKKIKKRIIYDIQKIQNSSKYTKYCYIIAACIIYIPLFVTDSFTKELLSSLSLLILGTLILGAIFHTNLYIYIYFKNKNKFRNTYLVNLEKNNKEVLINLIREIDKKI
ncbi:hypothetical protein [Acinetobacter bereziniae]|uniref:hypothetical protein n=1 Tax=Acinetobacter bereziniae TaxID=106648 RepID=UPI001900D48A|nr:hypothetical protein [Acinetobacter bereziniae]MBJ8476494.1 hypothetical protein [Acinetobacter bereziniae]